MATDQNQPLFFVKSGDEEIGPYSANQLKQFAQERFLTSESSIRKITGKWKPVKEVKGLKELIERCSNMPDEKNTRSNVNIGGKTKGFFSNSFDAFCDGYQHQGLRILIGLFCSE